MSKENSMGFWKGLFYVGLALAFVLSAVFLSSWISSDKEQLTLKPEQEIVEKVECPADYSAFASTTKKVSLVEDKPSNGTGRILKGFNVTLKRTQPTASVACGYLHYKVSFNNKPIEQENMNLYIRPTDGQFGGHILPDGNRGAFIDEIKTETGTITEVIMPLNTITYDGKNRNPIKVADWATLLNVSDEIVFNLALNADTPYGNLDLVEIVYKCINKETKRQTDKCEIITTGQLIPWRSN